MILEVCDICRKNEPTHKIKYKAEKRIFSFDGSMSMWTKIDICDECLRKIVNVAEEKKSPWRYN